MDCSRRLCRKGAALSGGSVAAAVAVAAEADDRLWIVCSASGACHKNKPARGRSGGASRFNSVCPLKSPKSGARRRRVFSRPFDYLFASAAAAASSDGRRPAPSGGGRQSGGGRRGHASRAPPKMARICLGVAPRAAGGWFERRRPSRADQSSATLGARGKIRRCSKWRWPEKADNWPARRSRGDNCKTTTTARRRLSSAPARNMNASEPLLSRPIGDTRKVCDGGAGGHSKVSAPLAAALVSGRCKRQQRQRRSASLCGVGGGRAARNQHRLLRLARARAANALRRPRGQRAAAPASGRFVRRRRLRLRRRRQARRVTGASRNAADCCGEWGADCAER